MGGFLSGLLSGIGQQVQQKHLLDVENERQRREGLASTYERLAQTASPDMAQGLATRAMQIRSTPYNKKLPKEMENPMDLLQGQPPGQQPAQGGTRQGASASAPTPIPPPPGQSAGPPPIPPAQGQGAAEAGEVSQPQAAPAMPVPPPPGLAASGAGGPGQMPPPPPSGMFMGQRWAHQAQMQQALDIERQKMIQEHALNTQFGAEDWKRQQERIQGIPGYSDLSARQKAELAVGGKNISPELVRDIAGVMPGKMIPPGAADINGQPIDPDQAYHVRSSINGNEYYPAQLATSVVKGDLVKGENGNVARQMLDRRTGNVVSTTNGVVVPSLMPTTTSGTHQVLDPLTMQPRTLTSSSTRSKVGQVPAPPSASAPRPATRTNGASASSTTSSGVRGLTPEAIEMEAQSVANGGQAPPATRGNQLERWAVINRAAQIRKSAGLDVPLNVQQAEFSAGKAALTDISKKYNTVMAFENTAGKNLDNFLESAKHVVDAGSPLLNRAFRGGARVITGSSDQATFDAARTVAFTEISKVLSGSMGAQLSDASRHEAEGILRGDYTVPQLMKVARLLKNDMANRRTGYEQQMDQIRKGMGGKPSGSNVPPPPGQATVKMRSPTGQVSDVPSDQVEHFKQRGATVVQ